MAHVHPPHDTNHEQGPNRDHGPGGHDDHDHHDADHAHEHGRHHHHPSPAQMGRAFGVGIALNTVFVAAEVGAGLWAGSLALLADAGHNLSDVLALILAWGAATLARRAPTARRTYGLRKTTILASLANAILLMVAVGAIISESIRRLAEPASIQTGVVMLTAGLGVVINTATALLFFRGSHSDLNVRGAFVHMAGDAAVSLVVVIGALVIARTGLTWVDPALGLGIAAFILFATWGLLRESVDLSLDAVPKEIDVAKVHDWLAARPGVVEVHDLHIWAMSTTEIALTVHLIRPAHDPAHEDGDAFLHQTCEGLSQRFKIDHATVQVERDPAAACRLAPAEVV